MKRLILTLLVLSAPLAFGEPDGNYLLGARGAAVRIADGYDGSASPWCPLKHRNCAT